MGIEDELKKYIDQRIDQRLAGITVRLGTGSVIANDADQDYDDDDTGGIVRRRKKKRRGKKKAATSGKKRGKKRGKKVRTVSSGGRDSILALLMQRGPMRVTQMVEITGIAQSTINKYLNALIEAKLAARLKEGTKVLFKAVHDGRVGRKTAEKPGKAADKAGTKKSEPSASASSAAA